MRHVIPDLALLRDRSKTKRIQENHFHGFLAMGWTGSARQLAHITKRPYVVLARPVHAARVHREFHRRPGLLPPCRRSRAGTRPFSRSTSWSGAVFCGFGMMLVLLIPLRKLCHFEKHHHAAAALKPSASSPHGERPGHCVHLPDGIFHRFWYSGDPYERWVFGHRLSLGQHLHGSWRLDFDRRQRLRAPSFSGSKSPHETSCSFSSSACLINIGMWSERFVIMVGSLYQEFLPSELGLVSCRRAVDIGTFTRARSARSSRCICCS